MADDKLGGDQRQNHQASVLERFAYKKLIDAVKALKAKTPEVSRADIEVQVSLADAMDEALATGEATRGHSTAFQVGTHEVACAEVDRWRKLRAIPEDEREAYYTDIPKPSRNGLFKWWASRCVDATVLEANVDLPDSATSLDQLPQKHFGCIYADPTWLTTNSRTTSAKITRPDPHLASARWPAPPLVLTQTTSTTDWRHNLATMLT